MSKETQNKTYKVGYGKPPVSGRFKSGVSGNKRGRPKKRRTLESEIADELNKRITVSINGKREKLTTRQAIVKKIMHSALSGDHRAVNYLLGVASSEEENRSNARERIDYSQYTTEELSNLYRKIVSEKKS